MTVEKGCTAARPHAGRVSFEARDRRDGYEYVGATRRRLKVVVDNSFTEADFRVAVGLRLRGNVRRPLDIDFRQAAKALEHAVPVVVEVLNRASSGPQAGRWGQRVPEGTWR
ncbi:MAG: hypothetical protein QXJ59_11035 [Thermofilaceae archaeon]